MHLILMKNLVSYSALPAKLNIPHRYMYACLPPSALSPEAKSIFAPLRQWPSRTKKQAELRTATLKMEKMVEVLKARRKNGSKITAALETTSFVSRNFYVFTPGNAGLYIVKF